MPYQVATGQTINAADINQLAVILQRPSGTQESGKYFLVDSSYATGANVGDYVSSISRTATPVSVAIDTTDQAATNCGAPTTDHLTSNGFRVSTTSTGVNVQVIVGGGFTISY
jgi:hypothetical protein